MRAESSSASRREKRCENNRITFTEANRVKADSGLFLFLLPIWENDARSIFRIDFQYSFEEPRSREGEKSAGLLRKK